MKRVFLECDEELFLSSVLNVVDWLSCGCVDVDIRVNGKYCLFNCWSVDDAMCHLLLWWNNCVLISWLEIFVEVDCDSSKFVVYKGVKCGYLLVVYP